MNYVIAMLLFPISDYTALQVLEQGTRHVMMMKMEPAAVVQCMETNASKHQGGITAKTEVMDRFPGALQATFSQPGASQSAVAVAQVSPVPGGSQTYLWITPNSYRSPADVADALWSGCGTPAPKTARTSAIPVTGNSD